MEKNKLTIAIYRTYNGAFDLHTAQLHEVQGWQKVTIQLLNKPYEAWIRAENFDEYCDRMKLNNLMKITPDFAK